MATTQKRKNVKGTVYLLHFSQKYHHAGHYLGFAEKSFENCIEEHRNGRGARLTRVIREADIDFECARTWDKKTAYWIFWRSFGQFCQLGCVPDDHRIDNYEV